MRWFMWALLGFLVVYAAAQEPPEPSENAPLATIEISFDETTTEPPPPISLPTDETLTLPAEDTPTETPLPSFTPTDPPQPTDLLPSPTLSSELTIEPVVIPSALSSSAFDSLDITFDAGIPQEWRMRGDWVLIHTERGAALQADIAGGALSFDVPRYPFTIELDLWLQAGSLSVQVSADGPLVTLTPHQLSVSACAEHDAAVALQLAGWHTLRITWREDGVRAALDHWALDATCDLPLVPVQQLQLVTDAGLIRLYSVRLTTADLMPLAQTVDAPPMHPTAIQPAAPSPMIAPQPLSSSAPPAPLLTYPPVGAQIGDHIESPLRVENVIFDWQMPTGSSANTYQLELSSHPRFLTISEVEPLDVQPGIGLNLNTIASGGVPDGRYYWRVRAINAGGSSPWSAPRALVIDRIPPPAVTLHRPVAAASAFSQNPRPTFSWSPAAGAVRYRLLVSYLPDLSVPVTGYENRILTGLSFTGSGALNHAHYVAPLQGQFFWAVYPIDAANNVGSADIRDSYIDLRRTPAPDALLQTTPNGFLPRLEWVAVAGATTYQLDLATNPFFSQPRTHTLTANVYTLNRFDVAELYPSTGDVLRPGAVVFWRVRLPDQPNGYLAPRAFFITDQALGAPRITAPMDGVRLNDTPSFLLHSPLQSLASTRVDAEIQVSTSSSFPPHATHIAIAEFFENPIPLGHVLPPSAGTTYFWRARFIYHTPSREIASPFTPTRRFIFDTQPPTFTPLPTLRVQNLRPTLSFPAAAGAVSYTVTQLRHDTPTIISPTPLTAPRFTPTADLVIGENILTVQAIDAAGNSAEATLIVWVDIAQSPAASAAVSSPVTLRWASQPNYTQYTVEIATDPTFSDLLSSSATVSGSAHTVALDAGVVYWRVYPTGALLSENLPSRALYVSTALLSRAALGTIADDNALNMAEHAASDVLVSCQGVLPEHALMLHSTPYQLEMAADAAFSRDALRLPAVCDGLAHPQLPVSALVSRPFVRVLTVYEDGLTLMSPSRRVTVDLTPPPVPILLNPVDDGRMTTPLPTLRWQPSAGVRPRDGYRVEFFEPGQAMPFRVVYASAPELVTSRLPASTFEPLPQMPLEWRVVALDAAGNESASPRRTFTVHLGISPAQHAYLTTTLPEFTFERYPSHAGTYQLIITTDPAFTTLHSQHVVMCPSAPCRFTLPSSAALTRETDYYWIVLPSTTPFDPSSAGTPAHLYVLAEADTLTAPSLALIEGDADGLLNAAQASDGLTFAWAAPTGLSTVQVVGYELQVSRSITFTPLTALHITPDAATTATLPAAWPDGKYFWRVRAVLDRGGHSPFSPIRTFTFDQTPPATPVITAPLSSTLTTTHPRFTWRSSAGVAAYEGTINGVPFTTTSTEYAPVLAQGQATLTLHAVDPAGNLSAPRHATWMINLSQLPRHQAVRQQTSAALPVDFTWAAPAGYSGTYTLYLDADGDFTTIDTVDGMTLAPITTTINRVYLPHLPEGIYRWWVSVGNVPLPDPFAPFTFAQTRGGVPAPTLHPVAGDDRINAAEHSSAQFTWEPPLGAAWQPVSYTFELARSSAFMPVVYQTTMTETTLDTELAPIADGAYFWRVRVFYPHGYTRTSPPRAIIIDRAEPPSPPLLLNPAPHWVFVGVQPSFSWSSPPTSAYFRLDILSEDGLSLVRSYIVTSPRLTIPTGAPLPAGTYLWRVQAYDAAGNASPLSALRRLRVTD